MPNFKWEKKTKEIFELLTSSSPGPFRKKTIQVLEGALVKRIGEDGTVTEPILIECVKETTPKPFIPMGMKKIKHLLEDQSLAKK